MTSARIVSVASSVASMALIALSAACSDTVSSTPNTVARQYGPSQTVGNEQSTAFTEGYRSTAAITRFKIKPTAAGNFVIGTQLLIYKRLAS